MIKPNRKTVSKVYLEEGLCFKEFPGDLKGMIAARDRVAAFRKANQPTEISGWTVTPAEVVKTEEEGNRFSMPVYEGPLLSEITGRKEILEITEILFKWYAFSTERSSSPIVHGDLHGSNIIINRRKREIVLIDPLARPGSAETIWLDVLIYLVSLELQSGKMRLLSTEAAEIVHKELIEGSADLQNRRIKYRQALLLLRLFLMSSERWVTKIKSAAALFRVVLSQ